MHWRNNLFSTSSALLKVWLTTGADDGGGMSTAFHEPMPEEDISAMIQLFLKDSKIQNMQFLKQVKWSFFKHSHIFAKATFCGPKKYIVAF